MTIFDFTDPKTSIPTQPAIAVRMSDDGKHLLITQRRSPGADRDPIIEVARANITAFVKAINQARSSSPNKAHDMWLKY